MTEIQNNLKRLQLIEIDSSPEQVSHLILLIIQSIQSTQIRELKQSNICLTKILCKIQLWYNRAYDKHFNKQICNYISFCSQYDKPLYDFCNLVIMVARTGWYRPVHDVLTSLNRTVGHQYCYTAVQQLCFTVLTRLISDDQIIQLLGYELLDILKSASMCLISTQYQGFVCPSTIHFVKAALLRITIGHEQWNYGGMAGSAQAELTTQTMNDIIQPQGPRKLVNENIFMSVQSSFNFTTAEEAIAKQKNNIIDLAQQYLSVISLLYFFILQTVIPGSRGQMIQLGGNTQSNIIKDATIQQEILKQECTFGKGIAELIEILVSFILQLNIRLYKFASAPAGMLPFFSQVKKAKQAFETSNGDKKLQAEVQQAIQKLPNIKYLQKIREQCANIAQQFIQLAIRLISFLNIKKQASRFGHCVQLWIQGSNLLLYVNKQIQYLQEEQQYSEIITRYVLGAQENMVFGFQFVFPSNNMNQQMKQYFAKIQLFQQQDYQCHEQNNLFSLDESLTVDQKYNYIIQECRAYNEDNLNIFNFCNLYSVIYGNKQKANLIQQQYVVQQLFDAEEAHTIQQLLNIYEQKFQLIKEMLLNKQNYIILQYADNALYVYYYASLYQFSNDDQAAISIISQVITGIYKYFDLTTYNLQSLTHVFIMMLVQTSSITKIAQTSTKAIFDVCKQLLEPLLSGFIYNFSILNYQKLVGNLTQSSEVTYNTCNLSNYSTFQCGAQNSTSQLIKEQLEIEQKTIVTSSMTQCLNNDVVRFEPKLIISAVMQTINFILNTYNDQNTIYSMISTMYSDQVKKSNVQYLLNLIVNNYIIISLKNLQLFDSSIISNITQLLFLLFTKINQFNAFSQNVFIKQISSYPQLNNSIKRYLLAQTQQDLEGEKQKMDNFITLLYSIKMQPMDQSEDDIMNFIDNQMVQLKQMYSPLKVLIRSIMKDKETRQMDDYFDKMFKINDLSNIQFYQKLNVCQLDEQIYHLIAKLLSYLYEYECNSSEEQKQHYQAVIYCIFSKQNGIFTKVTNFKQDNRQAEIQFQDQSDYIEELMFSSLSKYYNKNRYVYIYNFLNYYLILFAQRYEINLETCCGEYLNDLLIMENQQFRMLFYQILGYNSIQFKNSQVYSYVLTQLINSKQSDSVEYLLSKLQQFDNNIDPNIIISSIALQKYQIQLYVVQYLQQKSYYMDTYLLNKILNNGYKNYSETLMYRPGLANHLYNFNNVILEQIMPVCILQAQLNMLTPIQYIQLYQNIKFDILLQKPYFCNVIHASIHAFALNINHLTLKIPEKHFNGVINGDKDSSYYLSLDKKYFQDLRVLENQVTQVAIKFYHGKMIQQFHLFTLSDVAAIQYRVERDIIIKNIQDISINDVLTYLNIEESIYNTLQSIQSPKYMIKCEQNDKFTYNSKMIGPIKDFIHPQQLVLYVEDQQGYTDINTYSTKITGNQVELDRYTLNYKKVPYQYSNLSIQIALQILYRHLFEAAKQYDEKKLNTYFEVLFSLIEQQTYTYIKESHEGNILQFIDLFSLMEEHTLLLASKIIYNIVFKLAEQKQQSFQIFDSIFQRLTTSILQYLSSNEQHSEIFSYQNNIIQSSLEEQPQQYIPKDNTDKQCIVDILSRILVQVCSYNFCTQDTRIIAKISQQLLNLNLNIYLKYIFSFISQDDPNELSMQKVQLIVNHQDLSTILNYILYIAKLQDFINICKFITHLIEFYLALDQTPIHIDEKVLSCIVTVFQMFLEQNHDFKDEQWTKYITANLQFVQKVPSLCQQLKETFQKLQQQFLHQNIQIKMPQLYQQMQKVFLLDPDLKKLAKIDDKNIQIDDRLVMLQYELQKLNYFQLTDDQKEQLSYLIRDMGASKLTIEEIVRKHYEVFKNFGQLINDFYRDFSDQITTYEMAKSVIYCAMLFGIQNLQNQLSKISFCILQDNNQQNNEIQTFGDFGKENEQENEEDDEFGDFGGFQDEQQQNQVQKTTLLNEELLTKLEDILLPVMSAIPDVSNNILAGFLQCEVTKESLDSCFSYIQTYIFNFTLNDYTAERLINKILYNLDVLDDQGYEMWMGLLYEIHKQNPGATNAVMNLANGRVLEAMQNATQQVFSRKIQQNELKMKFL